MNSARLHVEPLTRWQALHGSHDLLRRELPAMTNGGCRTHRFRDRFDAAQSAARRPGHAPPSLLQAIGSRLTKPHPQLDTVIEVDDVQRVDIGRRVDDAFAQAEAEREVLQILRCRHHYGIGAAVIGDRYRGLLWNRTTARARSACPPTLAINGSGRFHLCIAPFRACRPKSD